MPSLKGAEWADWDQRGRLVFARGGRAYALAADVLGEEPRELADFNGDRPAPVEAPDWAKAW